MRPPKALARDRGDCTVLAVGRRSAHRAPHWPVVQYGWLGVPRTVAGAPQANPVARSETRGM
eukprot:scaffold141986_cov29-Tisochrysis_lutea.AAC.5